MLYLLMPIVVPTFIYFFVPIFFKFITQKKAKRNLLLILSCLVYFISWYLPSPLIEGKNTSFTTHFVGGGIFAGFLWLYIKNQLRLKLSPILEIVSLFAFVSMLGVVNELGELVIVQLHLVRRLNIIDTSWDLLANTLGVGLFWLIYKALKIKND